MQVRKFPPTQYLSAILLAITAVLLTGAVLAAHQQDGSSSAPRIVRIYYDDISDLHQLVGYDLFEYNNLEEHYVQAAISAADIADLRRNGWLVVEERPSWLEFATNSYFGGYRTVDELYREMGQLASQWPKLTELVPYGRSYCKTQNGCTTPGGEQTSGYELLAIRVTNEEVSGASLIGESSIARGQKPILLIMANIHGRELTTPEIAMRWLAHLLEEYGHHPDITWLVDWHELWIIPTVNPDGHWVTELNTATGNPLMHRKNFDPDADGDGQTDCNVWPTLSYSQLGVDLNRNHSFAWRPPSSTTSACELTYSGPAPASEPEVEALQGLIKMLFADRRGSGLDDPAPEDTSGLLFTLHNYGEMILRPWAYTGDPSPNELSLKAIGDKLGSLSGYRSCRSPECLYFAYGTTDDWAYGELGIAAFTFEIGADDQGFSPPYPIIDEKQWPENRPAFLYAAKIARAPYRLIHGPVVTSLAVTASLGGKFTLEVLIDDEEHGGQPVVGAEYTVDDPFWTPQAKPERLIYSGDPSATQGAFVAEIDTSGLAPGQHAIFVRGTDLDGNTGPPRSIFFSTELSGQPWPETLFMPILAGQ